MSVQQEALAIVERAVVSQPRTLQRAIGPSEVGTDCLHCLAAKLVNWPQLEDMPWLAWVGTSIHASLEEIFTREEGWLTETRVNVGQIAGQEISGTCDLFHIESGTAIDFKTVGRTTLTSAKRGPSDVYKVQANLYAIGWVRAGYDVKRVAIWYMPRNEMSLRKGIWWEEDFEPLLALAALDRATALVATLEAFPTIEERDAYITSLPRSSKCWDCGRYADRPVAEPKAAPKTLAAALGV